MKHLDEFQMVMHRFGDDAGGGAAAHLETCERCRAEYARISTLLAAVEPPVVPERGDDYGTQVWLRIRDRLPESKVRWLWLRPRQWAAIGAVAALVIAAFLAGEFHSSRNLQPIPGSNVARIPPPAEVRERVLVVALGDHLERSQMLLLELTHAPSQRQIDFSAEQQQAEDLVAANRLYRQTAASVGETQVARVLEQLERVLLDVAHGPSQLTEAQLKDIQRQIDAQGLVFKIRVLGSKVRSRSRPEAFRTPEGSAHISSTRQSHAA